MKSKKVESFPDLTPNLPEVALEKGIIKIVEILNGKGLTTEMSCEGHSNEVGKDRAWIQIGPSSFKSYMKSNSRKMGQFLKAGEGKWLIRIDYFGKTFFKGLGQPQPRKRTLKRSIEVEMEISLILDTYARNSKDKTKSMKAMERAANKYL